MAKPIANMSPEELRALTPEQMAHLIITDNFDTGQLARGLYLNLTKDIEDCLRAYGEAQRERDARLLETRCVVFGPGGRQMVDDDEPDVIRRMYAAAIRAQS